MKDPWRFSNRISVTDRAGSLFCDLEGLLRPGVAKTEERAGNPAIVLDEGYGLEPGMLHRSESQVQQFDAQGVIHGKQGPEGKLVEAFEHLEGAGSPGAIDRWRGNGGVFGVAGGGIEV